MATRARFGRLPRSAPSLTSTIVSLAQEYMRVRENNLLRAWKEGGDFEGKPVTDQMVTKWLKDRRDETTPGDPKWDYYNNQLQEYTFSIANSKKELEYKRGDASDKEMVAFYHSWSAKLPKNSEAYRAREKLAAAYADRDAAGSRAAANAARDKAYVHSINQNFKNEAPYDNILFAITNAAWNLGILDKKKGETLENIDPLTADGARIEQLWDDFATSDAYAPDRAWYTKQIEDATGKPFNGDFSKDAFKGHERIKKSNVTDRVRKANKADKKEDANAFKKEKTAVRATDIVVSGFDETVAYEDANAAWIAVFEDPASTPLMIDRANAEYVRDLEGIKAGLETKLKPGESDERLGWVNNELLTMSGKGEPGSDKPLTHWGGASAVDLGNAGGIAAAETQLGVRKNMSDIELLTQRDPVTGEPLFVLTKVITDRSTGISTPVNTDPTTHAHVDWGVVPKGMMDPNAIYVITSEAGDPRSGKMVTGVTGTGIHVVSDVPDPDYPGTTKVQKNEKPSAFAFTLPDGSTGYRYVDSLGRTRFTPDNPFGTVVQNPDGTTTTTDADIRISQKGGTVHVQGNGYSMPSDAISLKPQYYDAKQNDSMTSSVVKSGYSLMLIASNPGNRTVYAQNPDDIFASLKAEAGNDLDLLAEKIADADMHRAVYIGNSTYEQQRIRQNALTGSPNPVPLSTVAAQHGIRLPGDGSALTEADMIQSLTGGKSKDQLIEDIRESNRAGAPAPTTPSTARKYAFVSPTSLEPTKPTPTSLGSGFSSGIAMRLGDIIAQNTAAAQADVARLPYATTPKPPAASSSIGGYNTGAPGATAPPKATAPPAAKPPPESPEAKAATPTAPLVSPYVRRTARSRSGDLSVTQYGRTME